ncbi:DUF1365 family protein [Devosia sp. SD17-2]|jgi:DUF1365 family protein|uniref:DUF1365 domain-containing protein n=1 Tax=Devosia sp. SD17-2 TaxID=2976459 RepID=UPI0023D84463|nr:DUF1365 family protein [Devosia sp. SD17-2]WEJ33596.1 DUF1365 domain-containing protein [Devosia sp. SD17-2]
MSPESGIYTGQVVHARLRPKKHKLAYKVFCLLLDLDELEALDRGLKLFAFNRWGVLSFRERDHGDGGPLKAWVVRKLVAEGIVADGSIRVLCYPAMFGYVFNPLTVYFCHGQDGALKAMIYEVHNTHQERHAYVLKAGDAEGGRVQQAAAKNFFVSPFMPMECTYNFSILPPGEKVSIGIRETDEAGTLLTASFAGDFAPLTDRGLLRALVGHPLMTLKVSAGIYWEALKLVAKGFRIFPHTPIQPRVQRTRRRVMAKKSG